MKNNATPKDSSPKDVPAKDFPAKSDLAIGKNAGRAREHNRRVVLDAIRQHGPIGRAEIGRLTHLTAQTISNIVAELEAEALLLRQGRARTPRGQPPVQLVVNPDGALTVGVEITASRVTIVLVDLAGCVRAERAVRPPGPGPEHVVPLIAREIEAARMTLKRGPARLIGIGVVMPGPFGVEGMSSVGPTTLPGWTGCDPAALISSATGVSVTIENDANAAAVGERLHGAGRDLRHFCLLYFGIGLGLGIVAEGRPFHGAFGNAGEIGHVVVQPGGRACSCGNRGCFERYVSFDALRERLAEAGITCDSPDEVQALHAAQNPVLAGWIVEVAPHLRALIAMVENLFDPESIILGGSLPDPVIDALIAAANPLLRSIAERRLRTVPRLMRGATGRTIAALGAAALPWLETVTPVLEMASMTGGSRASVT